MIFYFLNNVCRAPTTFGFTSLSVLKMAASKSSSLRWTKEKASTKISFEARPSKQTASHPGWEQRVQSKWLLQFTSTKRLDPPTCQPLVMPDKRDANLSLRLITGWLAQRRKKCVISSETFAEIYTFLRQRNLTISNVNKSRRFTARPSSVWLS